METARHLELPSDTRLRELYEEAPVIYLTAASDGTITSVNRSGAASLGYRPEELIGSSILEVYADGSCGRPRASRLYQRVLAGEEIKSEQLELKRADGSPMWGSFTGQAVRSGNGATHETLSVLIDVTERKALEDNAREAVAAANLELRARLDQLTAALSEKEVLIREVHHRVKNNLQVISSLLNLQARRITDPSVLELFRESQNRVQAIALFHERLFRSEDLAHIDLGEYLGHILRHSELTSVAPYPRTTLHSVPIKVGMDIALPCGLIVNELINSGARQARERAIETEFNLSLERHENQVHLTFSMGTSSSPKRGLDPESIAKGGIDLVETLVDQLRGSLELCKQGPPALSIIFNLYAEVH